MNLSTCSSIEELGVPDLLDLDPAEHHPDDRLDVLVVDGDALEPVDGLDLLEEVLGQLLLAEDAEDVVGVDRPVHEGVAGPDPLAVGDAEVGALGDEVLLLPAPLVADDDLAVAADEAADLDGAVDLGDDGRELGPPGLEELLGPGQAARDVLGAGRLAGDLGQDVAGEDLLLRP